MIDFSQILSAFTGFAGGLIGGFVIEHYRLKHVLKVEKIKRLAPYLEQVYPIIRDLTIDSAYAIELQQRGDKNLPLLKKLCKCLKEFGSWYRVFRQNGMEPELESLDRDLCRLLSGVFVYSQLSAKYGTSYIFQRLERFHSVCLKGRESLEKLLKG